jgi:iron(III) transport system substrate-binding protein
MKKLIITLFFLFILGSCSTENPVIVYTNVNQEINHWLVEYAESEGFDVNIISFGGYDMYHRLLAEKDKPYADVYYGLNIADSTVLEQKEMLISFDPDWKNELVLESDSSYFYPLITQQILLYYNSNMVNPPTTYSDLTKPIYDHQYTIKRFGGYTPRYFIGQILLPYRDPQGELNISKDGWNKLETIITNCVYADTIDSSFQDVLDNKIPIAITNSAVLANYQLEHPINDIEIVNNNNEVLYTYENVGILKNNKNTTNSIEFVEWLGSEKVQLEYAREFGLYTNNIKAREQLPKQLMDFYQNLPEPFNYDRIFYNENIESWVRKLDTEFQKKLRH